MVKDKRRECICHCHKGLHDEAHPCIRAESCKHCTMKVTSPVQKTSFVKWEKEFEKKFGDNLEINEGMTGLAVEEYHTSATRKVKGFIKSLLKEYKDKVI